jgi:hypothetical protein
MNPHGGTIWKPRVDAGAGSRVGVQSMKPPPTPHFAARGLASFMHFLESQLFINFLGFLACFLF